MNNERLKGGVESWFFHVTKYADSITWVVLFVMMMMTMTDVFLRKFSNLSILGTVELTELMMVIVVFCSLAQCQVEDGHIKVDFVLKRFSPRVRSLVDTFTQFACFVLFCLMTWSIFNHASGMKEWGEVTLDLRIIKYPFVYMASFGCALLSLVLLLKTIAALKEVIKS